MRNILIISANYQARYYIWGYFILQQLKNIGVLENNKLVINFIATLKQQQTIYLYEA